MKIREIILLEVGLLAGILSQSGCKMPVYDADVQFVERLVVNGVLRPGQPVTGLYVGRTLPVTASPYPTQAEVHDASVAVTVDGNEYPLYHSGSGLYGNTELIAESGHTYELLVAWNGLVASAHTLVPHVPDTSSITFVRTGMQQGEVIALLVPHPDEMYGMTCLQQYRRNIFDTPSVVPGPVSALLRATDVNADGEIHLVSGSAWLQLGGEPDSLWATINAVDHQFYAYYYSAGSTSDFDNLVLGVNPATPSWNVTGDGIGLFLGRSTVTRAFVLPATSTFPTRRSLERRHTHE